ncbi:lazarillo protein-like [Daphnia carinata]|uniref:lazarillo protein-like n=1 Tax=Daphnia carinata TaxID=120202 RepID=UPI00257B6ED4|nr:lazarillo protein-like [Daphnia carinata]
MLNHLKFFCSLLIMMSCYRPVAHGQVYALGSCPNLNVVSDFKIDQYLGKWYSNRSYFPFSQSGLECITAEYVKNGAKITMKNVGIKKITRTRSTTSGTLRHVQPPNGKLSVSFFGDPTQGNANYWVLDTDYTSYSVVWSCMHFGIEPINTRIVWILTREQHPSNATVNAALTVLRKNGIDQSKLRLTNQQDC